MRPAESPATSAPLQRSVAACLASILELDVGEVPVPEEAHPKPWTVWRNWLAQRGLGLVPINEPASFNWPGPWLAVLPTGEGEERIAVVAFGSPPGVAWNPSGGAPSFEAVEQGYLIAPADVALWAPPVAAAPRLVGRVDAVLVASAAEAAMTRADRAVARAGRGLEGDRYFEQGGTFSDAYDRGHDLTLIEAEALGTLGLPSG